MRGRIDQFVGEYLERYQAYQKYWNYEDGCLLMGAKRMYEATSDPFFRDYILRYLSARVLPDGSIPTYITEHDNLDDLNCGKLLFFAIDETGDARYRKALDYHMERLHRHPRCKCGNFWHKDIYPNQIWLDGLYMAQPLYMEYETKYGGMENYPDILQQFANVRTFLRDEKSGLYYHGYDEARVQPWADRESGCSANFWSRAYGWWLIALVDTIEAMNKQVYEGYALLRELLQESVRSLLPHRDPETGLILQIIDRPDLPGNYTESSGSVMAAAAIMKAVRLGLLLEEKYLGVGIDMFESVCRHKLYAGSDGVTRLQDICHVAGLGPGEKRDGSVAYYLSEPISADDAKGVGPFLMAYAEYIRATERA